jgi:large subunit ribosomal protein L22
MSENIVKASLRELRLAPRKVALVAALVRGRTVDDALIILEHTPKRAAKPLAKLIASARANATNNHGLRAENLRIETLSVTAGPRLKRYRPVSRGMAHPFQKRTSHIFIEISGEMKPVKKAATESKKPVTASEAKQSSDKKVDRRADKSARDDRDDKKGEK